MLQFLQNMDKALFLFINKTLANPVSDAVMPVITEPDNWRIPIIILILALLIFGKKKGAITLLLAACIITCSDQLSSSVIKPLVGRVRPCFVVEGARLLIHQSRSFSFPSSHAANMGAMAVLFAVRYRRHWWIGVTIALVVGLSRIVVGVHYPLDVLGGYLVGALCAAAVLACWSIIVRTYRKLKKRKTEIESV